MDDDTVGTSRCDVRTTQACSSAESADSIKSATGRIRRGEPGASPQEIGLKLGVSAEGGIHSVHDPRFQR
jgi:hypothetical protein